MSSSDEFIYDFDLKGSKKLAGPVIYEGTPVEERENPYTSGDFELMHVDDAYKLNGVSDKVSQFLTELRGYFSGHVLVTYQEIMDYARERVHFVAKDYAHNSHPVITQWMNMLWKAGLIDKYRRGLWKSTVDGQHKRGLNHGIAYDLWKNVKS